MRPRSDALNLKGRRTLDPNSSPDPHLPEDSEGQRAMTLHFKSSWSTLLEVRSATQEVGP